MRMANIAHLLTEHIDIWTSADAEKKSGRGRTGGNVASVYGVKKLRELILELAVRGKLVLQDANDEPASELLKRIQTEKTKLVGEGKLKKEKSLVAIGEDEKPYELPKGWVWVRNCELFQLRKGRIPKNLNEDGEGLPYLDIDALDRNTIRRYSVELSCPQSTDKDILVVCDGSRSGLVLDGKNGIIGSTLSIIDTPIYIQNYIKLIFKQGFEIFNTSMKGAAIPHLDTQKLLQNPTALPPFAEQHRIVTKVDELMALCDQLEQQHSNAQKAHEILVSQLLTTLTQSQNAAEFNENWQRIYAHFDVLFTTEASIDALKQTLLQLAVMGKLVPQDPNDEPASELLKRIQAEKAKLIAEGKLKKEKPLPPITEDEKPFELPKGWEWGRIGNLVQNTDYGLSEMTLPMKEGIPVLKMGDIQDGKVILGGQKKVRADVEGLPYLYLKPGDLLYNRTNSAELVGKTGVYEGFENEYTFASYLIRICCIQRFIFPQFLKVAMNTQSFRETQINPHLKQQCGQANVNGTILKSMVVPVTSLNEQLRIVAKVDALMVLCDQLKTRIQQANQQQQAIANALVAQAVQPTAEIINLADYRAATACYAIKKMQGKSYFGRTTAVKLLYLAEAHLGLPLKFKPMRDAAGPLDKWIYTFEKQGEHEGWFNVIEPDIRNGKTKVEYQVKSVIAQKSVLIEKICSDDQLKEFDRLLDLFAAKTTEEAEIIATLFAAWNDFLIDGHTPSDDEIVKEVRENWHESKARFIPAQLKESLNWMRRNHLVPQGRPPHTVYQQQLIVN